MANETDPFSSPETPLSDRNFKELCEIIYSKSGIALKPGKETLVISRVSKRLRSLKIKGFREYLEYLKSDETDEEIVHLLDVISTNVTSFFREPGPLNFFEDVVKKSFEAGNRRFRVWSAACSSGEEPYTMAMIMSEICGDKTDWKILATDISTNILEKAEKGIFSDEQIKSVPPPMRLKYFQSYRVGSNPMFTISPELREKVVFKRLNLSEPPFPMKGPMQMVFCRNVMIYFDDKVRVALLREIARLLGPGGYLSVGASESLTNLPVPFKYICPSVYQRQP